MKEERLKWLGLVLLALAVLYIFNVRTSSRIQGGPAPELDASYWLNTDKPILLRDLRGKVGVVEFWATWCGPCLDSIPRLNRLQDHDPDQLVVIGLTDEKAALVKPFIKRQGIRYTIGAGSASTRVAYGVRGVPYAFVIDRQGDIIWQGSPLDNLESVVERVLHTPN